MTDRYGAINPILNYYFTRFISSKTVFINVIK